MSINDIRINNTLILHFLLCFLCFYLSPCFLILLFSLYFLLFLHNFFIIPIFLGIILLVNSHYLIKDFLILKGIVCQHVCDIANIYEVILFNLFTNKGRCLGNFLGIRVITLDNSKDFISYCLKCLRGLVSD